MRWKSAEIEADRRYVMNWLKVGCAVLVLAVPEGLK